jgi:hypothetical protein
MAVIKQTKEDDVVVKIPSVEEITNARGHF